MTVTRGIGTTVVFALCKGQSAFWLRGYDTPLIVPWNKLFYRLTFRPLAPRSVTNPPTCNGFQTWENPLTILARGLDFLQFAVRPLGGIGGKGSVRADSQPQGLAMRVQGFGSSDGGGVVTAGEYLVYY